MILVVPIVAAWAVTNFVDRSRWRDGRRLSPTREWLARHLWAFTVAALEWLNPVCEFGPTATYVPWYHAAWCCHSRPRLTGESDAD